VNVFKPIFSSALPALQHSGMQWHVLGHRLNKHVRSDEDNND
jgi:hypothetical protein